VNIVSKKQTHSQQCAQKNNISFEAGLTPKMMQEIQRADILEISSRLAQKDIPTDFQGNKVVAWCSEKTVGIIQNLNERFGLKLALPKGIYVEDFGRLKVDNNKMTGFCNLLPKRLKKESSETPEMTVFFNTFETARQNTPQSLHWLYDWNNVNELADINYATKDASTEHFLGVFLHEQSHVSHEGHLLEDFSRSKVTKKLKSALDQKQIEEYQRKYGARASQICGEATKSPLEAVACDMSRKIVESLDRETLLPTRNPFIGSPYEQLPSLKRIIHSFKTDKSKNTDDLLRAFWDGQFC